MLLQCNNFFINVINFLLIIKLNWAVWYYIFISDLNTDILGAPPPKRIYHSVVSFFKHDSTRRLLTPRRHYHIQSQFEFPTL